jgi:hypothetical protein
MGLLDAYTMRARVVPCVVVLLPLVFGLLSWFPTGVQVAAGPLAALYTLAAAGLLSQFGAEPGRRIQPALFELWGGTPTTQLMSFATSTLSPETLALIHDRLNRMIPAPLLPRTKEGEAADPAQARMQYEAAVDWLRVQTHDAKAFPLVFEANVSYGFRRNLLGLRAVGVWDGLIGIATCAAHAVTRRLHDVPQDPQAIVYALLSAGLLVVLILLVNSNWVRAAAFEYAEQLLLTVERLDKAVARSVADVKG